MRLWCYTCKRWCQTSADDNGEYACSLCGQPISYESGRPL